MVTTNTQDTIKKTFIDDKVLEKLKKELSNIVNKNEK